jgi:hypothetical protein
MIRSIEEIKKAFWSGRTWDDALQEIYDLGRRDAVAQSAPVTIRQEVMGPHFTKYHIEGLPVPTVLHHITQAEPEADPHDHPWGFTSFVIAGGYVEEVFQPRGLRSSEWLRVVDGKGYLVERQQGQVFRVNASRVHRIVRLLGPESWTLILPGPPERKPGFYRWDENGQPLYRPWDRGDFQPLARTEP